MTRPFSYLEELKARYGDVFTMRLPGAGQTVVVASPEGLEQLVAGSYDALERDAKALRFLLGERALIFQDGARHRRLRNVMTPPFQGDRMRRYGPVMARVTDSVLDARNPEGFRPIQPDMQEITLRVILRCVFGLSDGPRFERMRELLLEFLKAMFTPAMAVGSMLLPEGSALGMLERLGDGHRRADPARPRRLSRLPLKRVADVLGAIDAILFEEIARCREEAGTRDDILSLLVQARDADGLALDQESLRDQLIMLLVAGHETTANSLCWALLQIAARTDVVAEIRAEQERVFAGGFDPQRVRELAYLGASIQESMRLMPVALGVARVLKQDLTIGGHLLEAGTVVVSSSYLAQRDPRLWERPLAFEPQRFLHKKPRMTAHFPFGAGVWRCLGAAFADYEMRVVLSRLFAAYDVALDPEETGKPALNGVTISPAGGLRVRLSPRDNAGREHPLTARA